jgi:transposase InsO family protein
MSNKGNPYDNAFMESFFKTLMNEEYIYGNIFIMQGAMLMFLSVIILI